MKLSYKFLLLTLSVMMLMTLSVLVAGRLVIAELSHYHHSQVLTAELGKIQEQVLNALNQSGEHAAARTAEALMDSLKEEPLNLKTGHIYVIEAPDRVIYHPNYKSGESIERKEIEKLFQQGEGSFEYDYNGATHFAVFTTIHPVEWLIFLSLDESEMYAKEVAYLYYIGLFAAVSFIISTLIITLFVRGFVRRVQTTLDGIKQIENGDLETRIQPIVSHDEIGRLQVGINSMSARIQARNLEQQATEQALRQSEAKYRQILDTANEGIWIQDDNYLTTYTNEHMAHMLGYTADELIGRKFTEFLFDEGLTDHPLRMKQQSHKLSDIYERRMRHKDGSLLWMLISATPIFEDNQFRGSFGMLTDITERKEAERQLITSEQLFRTLVENAPDFISRYDLDLNRVYINPALRSIFHVPTEPLLGTPPSNASPITDPERYMKLIRQAIESEKEQSDVLTYQAPNGDIHWVNMRFAPEFDPDGKIESVLVISNDITEAKHAEDERLAHLYFLDSLNRINLVLQDNGDILQTMHKALDTVLDIFGCDRVFLIYPCDPNASTWSVPIESTKPEYPGASKMGSQRMDEGVSRLMRTLLSSDHPVQVNPTAENPLPASLEQFSIRSFLATILRPREEKPWLFGTHQCSYERIWTDQELRLFEEIGHRLSDALNDFLITRDLRESEERFRLVYENSPIPIIEEDCSAVKVWLDELCKTYGSNLETYLTDHPEIVKECAALVRVVNVNRAALELHEAGSKEELYEGLPKTFIAESYIPFRQELLALARGKTELLIDSVVQTLSGKRRDVSVSFTVCPGYEESLSKVFISLFDITHRKQDEENLRLAASVFSTSQEGILISDADNHIIDINPAFCRLTGYTRDQIIGKNPSILSSGRHDKEFYAEMWQSINSYGKWQGEIWNKRKNDEVYPELISIVAVKNEQDQLQHYVGAFSDISALKQHETDLERIAHYDTLTSVPNRRMLYDRMKQAIAHVKRHGKNLAVCYLDLDGFKPINDQFGHDAGDRILIETARRLESMSRGEDTVARLGGDEFVILWNNVDTESDCILALERILTKVSEPILLGDTPVSVSASIGVTLYPDDKVDTESLLRHADHAMYKAKELGKNRYQIFDARLERQISAQAELLTMITEGLDSGHFELYYQPKVDYTSEKVVGIEALLRWNDPTLGLLGPKEFLSLMEYDNLALRMGRWVMEQTVCQAKRWSDMGITLPISFNIFPRHIKNQSFVDDLRSMIATHWPQLPKQRLLMEIIETTEMDELEPIEKIVNDCLDLGIGFSLDDFGTGCSSLIYLRSLSIEELKIDQAFIRDMLEDPGDEAIVISIISLGQAFGLRVVAEGVESRQQASHLEGLGCSIVQGYGFARPMPARAFQKWYTAFQKSGLTLCK